MHWWMFYGALTGALVVWTSLPWQGGGGDFLARRRRETFGAAVMLAALWLIWNLSHWFLDPYQQFFTVIDYVAGVSVMWWWYRSRQLWILTLGLLFVAQWPLHWTYILNGDNSFSAKYAYDLAQNVIYLGQLGTVFAASLARR